MQEHVLAPISCIFSFYNLQSKRGSYFFTGSYLGLCIIKVSPCVRFNLYNYVIDDTLFIASVNNHIHAGNSRMFSDGLFCRFLLIFIHLYQYKRLSHTSSEPSFSLSDTVFVIVFINKRKLLVVLYSIIFWICCQAYHHLLQRAGDRGLQKNLLKCDTKIVQLEPICIDIGWLPCNRTRIDKRAFVTNYPENTINYYA